MAGHLAQRVLSTLGIASTLLSPRTFCLPDDPCFPNERAISSLNQSLHGNLIRPNVPDFGCVTSECLSQEWRGDQPNRVMFTNFESGFGLEGSNASSIASVGRARTPEYIAEVQDSHDIVKVVEFSRRHNLRLRVKSTGHDYLGRSSDAGSLTIWTHRLKKTSFQPNFVPHGANVSYIPTPALTAQAGVQVIDLYTAADNAGVVVTGGVSKSVGAAGGFALGGGHGPLAPLHGLAVDNILQITVVLYSGDIVHTSPFSHQTLFSALRGGGSAFGVVVEIVFKAHPPPVAGFIGVLGTFAVTANATNPTEAWTNVLREWISLQPDLSAAGFSGYSYVRTNAPTPFAYVLPTSANADMDVASQSFRPFLDFADQHPDLEITYKIIQEPTFFKLWIGDFHAALLSLDAVGINLLLGGRLVPRTVVEQNPFSIADFISSAKSPSIVHLVAGGAVSKPSYFPSTVNPLWRETLLHIDLPVSWPSNASLPAIKGLQEYLTSHTLRLGELSQFPNGVQAAYPSEGDFNEEKWQSVWYGDKNYNTLLAAKKKYDPNGVFSGRKVPGSEFTGF